MGSFLAIQNGSICGNGTIFPLIQVVAALCILLSLLVAFNLASFLIQISYVAIGILVRRLARAKVKSPRSAAGAAA